MAYRDRPHPAATVGTGNSSCPPGGGGAGVHGGVTDHSSSATTTASASSAGHHHPGDGYQQRDHLATVTTISPEPPEEDEEQQQHHHQHHHRHHRHRNNYGRMSAAASLYSFTRRFVRFLRKTWQGEPEIDPDELEMMNIVRYKPDRIEALCRCTSFTKSEIKFMYQGFKQACPSGIVNESAFKSIYAQFFPQGDSSQYAHYVFNTFDKDHNGTIDFQDFVKGLSILCRGTPQDKLEWTFSLYDINGDGCITKEEMYEIIASIYLMMGRYVAPTVDETSAREHADRVFQKLDLNQDGVVTFDEFIETCLQDENIINSLNILDTIL